VHELSFPEGSAAAEGLATCRVCFKLAPATLGHCPRCHARLHLREPESLQRTLALLVTASLLYLPANLLPVMVTDRFGNTTENTILGGVVVLLESGSWGVAAIIFVASVLVPLAKIGALGWLCWSVARCHPSSARERTVLYRVTGFVGRWSMVDVFVVTILVALVHFGGLLRITPGAAAIAFGGVVVVTMLAAESFDPRLIWDRLGDSGRGARPRG